VHILQRQVTQRSPGAVRCGPEQLGQDSSTVSVLVDVRANLSAIILLVSSDSSLIQTDPGLSHFELAT